MITVCRPRYDWLAREALCRRCLALLVYEREDIRHQRCGPLECGFCLWLIDCPECEAVIEVPTPWRPLGWRERLRAWLRRRRARRIARFADRELLRLVA